MSFLDALKMLFTFDNPRLSNSMLCDVTRGCVTHCLKIALGTPSGAVALLAFMAVNDKPYSY